MTLELFFETFVVGTYWFNFGPKFVTVIMMNHIHSSWIIT